MITEKQVQKALRDAPASGKGAIELRDHGERGAGRLVIIVKPRTGRVTAAGHDRQKAMVHWGKTKNRLPHSIPLPHQAAAILDELPTNSRGLYFPHQTDPSQCARYGSLKDVIAKFIKENPGIVRFTPRDLRRTWKTLAGEAGLSKEIRDRIQNHAKGGDVSSRHYDRYGYLPERRAAMAKWAAYMDLVIAGTVDQIGAREGNVVPFGTAAGAQS